METMTHAQMLRKLRRSNTDDPDFENEVAIATVRSKRDRAEDLSREAQVLRREAAEIVAVLVNDRGMYLEHVAHAVGVTPTGLAKQVRAVWADWGQPTSLLERLEARR